MERFHFLPQFAGICPSSASTKAKQTSIAWKEGEQEYGCTISSSGQPGSSPLLYLVFYRGPADKIYAGHARNLMHAFPLERGR